MTAMLNGWSPGRCAVLGLVSLWFVASAAGNASGGDAERAITVASRGGPYEHSRIMAYFEPFTKSTGIRVDIERYDGGLAEIRKQAAGTAVPAGTSST